MTHDIVKLTQANKEFKGNQGFFVIELQATNKNGETICVQFLSKTPLKIEQLTDEAYKG
jgi:hypothetical protein